VSYCLNIVAAIVTLGVSQCEHGSTSERVTNEPRLGSPARFELDRAGAKSKVSGKIRVSGFPNWIVQFW
jgi:hypothetical protein